ncbi:histidine-type phosphatase [Novosphingobium sp. 9]|uniref:histidine-type phosphatase n=1 Tax=Novosphingobium sp. 9 TaxID=2025349 RepID=UPI0021B4ED17|nr:histidine-type phosphatase [Novosphingobium sp. 9]
MNRFPLRSLPLLALGLLGTVSSPSMAAPAKASAAPALTVDHVVLVQRHGVRPPTKNPALPEGMAAQDWPSWPVAFGWLTPHGTDAIARLGASDGKALRAAGLLPASGCPKPGTVRTVADSDQRTIATAAAWLGAVAPGCKLPSDHKPQDVTDPRFSPIGNGATFDVARSDAALKTALGSGGVAALEARYAPLLARVDAILCGPDGGDACGVRQKPTGVKWTTPTSKPKLTGALDYASTMGQALLLEYADGKPMADVGWGRATAQDVTDLSAFHALEYSLMARLRPVAQASFSGLAPIVMEGLTGPAKITFISGHDGNVGNLGGLLGVHWKVPGVATDDPVPGGAIVIESLHDASGAQFIRLSYRAQSLEQIRNPRAPGRLYHPALVPASCKVPSHPGLCTPEQFAALLKS